MPECTILDRQLRESGDLGKILIWKDHVLSELDVKRLSHPRSYLELFFMELLIEKNMSPKSQNASDWELTRERSGLVFGRQTACTDDSHWSHLKPEVGILKKCF